MSKNPHVNWMGMITFAVCMILSVGFFIFTLVFQPGPVDANQGQPPVGLTMDQYIERKQSWAKSSPEAIARGERSYKLNLAFFYEEGGQDRFLEMVKAGQLPVKGTELDLFRLLSTGNKDLGIMKIDHIREDERWDIVHYLRSLNTNLPSTPKSEWKKFFKEGA
jgi:hypothetical protein